MLKVKTWNIRYIFTELSRYQEHNAPINILTIIRMIYRHGNIRGKNIDQTETKHALHSPKFEIKTPELLKIFDQHQQPRWEIAGTRTACFSLQL